MTDSFYTPEILAEHLVSYVESTDIKLVADFCVGDGELLRAVKKKWPSAFFFGTDISPKIIETTKESHPDWILSKCDFLKRSSRNKAHALKSKERGFDLIVLNPPFSCLGAKRHKVCLNDSEYEVSTAMKFLVESLFYLSNGGNLYGILPVSVAYSQKDALIWKVLVNDYNLTVLEEPSINHFKECSPSVILVSLGVVRREVKNVIRVDQLKHNLSGVSLFRGKIGMYKLNGSVTNGHQLIHTTNLRENTLVNMGYEVDINHSLISGPAVLIPRVGLPNKEKMCVIERNETFALSDCVIAIKTKSNEDAELLLLKLISKWSLTSSLYKGTGARYVTLDRITQFLGLK